jgi:ketosteroid isomerase-like protein
MPKPSTVAACVLLALLVNPAKAFHADADAGAIRRARATMNMAFTSRDVAALTAFMTDAVTWSGPVWRLVGRQQVADAHQAFWTDRPDARWDYRPTDIRVFDAWHWLSERGTWVQAWTAADGPTELRGTYQAFWKHVNGQWRLDAHLFVTTSCKGGAFCRVSP